MNELHDLDKMINTKNRKMNTVLIVIAVLMVIVGIVSFVQHLVNEVGVGHLIISQSVIIFIFESIAVILISKALKRFVENRSREIEVSDS